jgi:hypothetical protein
MSETEPKRVVVGVFGEGVPNILVIPKGGLRPAEKILDAERQKRERLALEAKMLPLRQARARGKLKRALAQCFHLGRRGR